MASIATNDATPPPTSDASSEFLPQNPEAAVESLKKAGNVLFIKKKYKQAELKYCEAIELGSEDPKLFGNRSAARHHMERYEEALTDAMRALEIDPTWVKGYHRKAAALISLGQLQGGAAAYAAAVEIEPDNEGMKKKLASVNKRVVDAARRSRIRGLKHWLSIFTTQSDARLRLGVMASFWNEGTKAERLLIFFRFLAIIGGDTATSSANGDSSLLDSLKADFTEDRMTDLPLDNYSDLEIPEQWIKYFKDLSPDNKGEYFEAMYKTLSETEKTLVINDLRYFYSYDGSSPAAGEHEPEEKQKA